jgi:hypothetical protein
LRSEIDAMLSGFPHSGYGRSIRDVCEHNGVGSDRDVVADPDSTEDFGSGSDPYSVPQPWLAASIVAVTKGHALMQHEIRPGDHLMPDDDADTVDQRQPSTDLCGRVDLHARSADGARLAPVCEWSRRPPAPRTLRHAEQDDGAESWL